MIMIDEIVIKISGFAYQMKLQDVAGKFLETIMAWLD